jgi:hypothetical protein
MASRERDLRSAINTPVSNAGPASSSKEVESIGENETHSSGFSITPAGVESSANEQAPGKPLEEPAQPRCIEIGLVEGDALIKGGASHMFLQLPGKPSAEGIFETGSNVVRLAGLPGRSELHVPDQWDVIIREIAGNGKVFHASGRVNIGRVQGNLLVVDAPRGVLAEVGGDAVLDTSLNAHAEFVVYASANVTLRTHGEINARFVAQTSQGKITSRLPLMVERGRRRNLVGVIGGGDATVTLRSKDGNITILSAESNEREHYMNKEFAPGNKGREQEGSRIWEGGFGQHRFRAQWDREPGHARFHFQGPFTGDDDPDGFGVPFSPDFGFEWEQGRGAHAYGEYEEHWDNLREKAEQAARRAAKHAGRYAKRAARHMRDTNWDGVERNVLAVMEKAMAELQDALAHMRHEGNKRQAESESSTSEQGPKAQRVRIEYDQVDDPFEEDSSASSTGTASSTTFSREERDAKRRAILEELRTGAISIEEAEHRLNDLG